MAEFEKMAPPAGAFQVKSGEHTLIHMPDVGAGISHMWNLWHDPKNKMVGSMHQHRDGTVLSVEVHPDHRRQGLATKMWGIVDSLSKQDESIPAPKHSGSRTASGDKFAKSIGGELPKRTVISQAQFNPTRWSD
jgi:GNAT superfamily N-acetyltransferase